MLDRARAEHGQGLIGLVVSLLIGFAIMVFMLRANMPSKSASEAAHGAIDAAHGRAAAVEAQQKQQEQDLKEALQ